MPLIDFLKYFMVHSTYIHCLLSFALVPRVWNHKFIEGSYFWNMTRVQGDWVKNIEQVEPTYFLRVPWLRVIMVTLTVIFLWLLLCKWEMGDVYSTLKICPPPLWSLLVPPAYWFSRKKFLLWMFLILTCINFDIH